MIDTSSIIANINLNILGQAEPGYDLTVQQKVNTSVVKFAKNKNIEKKNYRLMCSFNNKIIYIYMYIYVVYQSVSISHDIFKTFYCLMLIVMISNDQCNVCVYKNLRCICTTSNKHCGCCLSIQKSKM